MAPSAAFTQIRRLPHWRIKGTKCQLCDPVARLSYHPRRESDRRSTTMVSAEALVEAAKKELVHLVNSAKEGASFNPRTVVIIDIAAAICILAVLLSAAAWCVVHSA